MADLRGADVHRTCEQWARQCARFDAPDAPTLRLDATRISDGPGEGPEFLRPARFNSLNLQDERLVLGLPIGLP